MNNPAVSVIIPFYNTAPYLRRCLDSVLSQDLTEYEIICINDGSTDDSLLIAEEYADQFENIRIISQENRGLSNARNRGMDAAHGEYFLFVDSDDYLEKNVLGKLYAGCRLHRLDMLDYRVDIVSGGSKTKMYPEASKTTGVSDGRSRFTAFIERSGKQPFVSAWSHMYRREFLSENGLRFIDGRKYEDLVFTATAYIRARAVMYLDLPVYNYVKVEGSITTSGITPAHITDMHFMAREISRLSEMTGIRIPMDTFFSGIRNQVIAAMKTGRWREYRVLFDRNLFRTTEFHLYRPAFRLIRPLAAISYSVFILYCRLTMFMKQLRLQGGLSSNRIEK
jgi:glycosyltransferase involved in cell wall biosynthesis